MAIRNSKEMSYSLDQHMIDSSKTDRAAGLAFFLMEHVGSIYGMWRGRMNKADQISMFGIYLGKGRIHIYGDIERVDMTKSYCFGTMRDVEKSFTWASLPRAA